MLNYEICQHADHTSSPNSVRCLCRPQHELDNGIDEEINKFCKECVDKKCGIETVVDLKVVDFSDAINNNAEISNERHDMLHNNSDEESTSITNERYDVFHKTSDEGTIAIDSERHDVLQNNSDEGNTSIMHFFKRGIRNEMNNNIVTNDSNSDDKVLD